MTMRERVARAIQTKLHPALAGKPAQAWYLEVADAAIAAMLIPTDAMIQAMLDTREEGLSTRNIWVSAVVAALGEITDGE